MDTAVPTLEETRRDKTTPVCDVTTAPPVGAAAPLSAAYCAERAARAIADAEASTTPDGVHLLLACATAWRELAAALATNNLMNRPREDRGSDRR